MLHSVVGQDDTGRRAAINTIGPLWDGNEVWLIVAGASMFAAFPGWYATMFSGLYLAMVLLLISLIIRGVAFEYRGKRDAARWRRTWDVALTVGSLLAPFVIGVALGDLLHGLPIDSSQNYTGSFWELFQPYAVYTGVTLVLICLLHGATFLSLKTTGSMHERSGRLARRVAPFTAAAVVGFAVWTHVSSTSTFFLRPLELLAILAVLAAVWLVYDAPRRLRVRRHRGHDGVVHRLDLRRPVPQRDGVEHQPGLQPHRAQHGVRPVLAEGDDRRRHHLPAAGTGLPDAGRTTCSGGGSAGSSSCRRPARRRQCRRPCPRSRVPRARPAPGSLPPALARWIKGARHGRKL